MQRFKDFTKKSGKVASAILSAAMVTSMVAGTNVVYAATETTAEATADVKADVKGETAKATEYVKAELDKISVASLAQLTTSTTGTAITTDGAFKTATENATKKIKKDKLNNVTDVTLKIKDTKVPDKDNEGSLKVTIEVNGTETGEKEYKIPSGSKRATDVQAAAQKYIDELVVTKSNKDNVAGALKEYLNKKEDNGFKTFAGADVTTSSALINTSVDEKTVTGTIPVTVAQGTYQTTVNVNVNKTIKTDEEALNEAATAVDKYLGDVKYFGRYSDLKDAETVINKVITDKYADYVATVTSASNIKVDHDNPAGKDTDGKRTITYTLVARADDKATATNEKTIKLLSNKSKYNQVMDDLKAVAADLTVTKDTTAADYREAFEKAFTEKYKDITVGEAHVTTSSEIYADVYGDVDVRSINFIPATETSAPMVVFEVSVYGEEAEKDSYVYGEEQEAPKGQFVEKDGKKYFYDANGELVKNRYIQADESGDGGCYWASADGSVYQDRLSYDPSGKEVIYFDAEGHMAFDKFVNVKKDVAGNPVDYIGFFDSEGRAYVNQTTYGNGEGAYSKDALFYINDYGVLENKGWFKNAAGEIGYAAPNGTLTTSQWSLDQFGRKVYFQANGFLAKGLMTDGVKYYQLDETDGHLVGEF